MVVEKGWNRAWRVLVLVAMLPWAAGVYAVANDESGAQPARVSYASVSDEDLTAIVARWDDLDAQQRRALLSEVKLRMKRNGTAEGVLQVNVRRRYGTVVRHPNGARATLRVEVRSVKKPGSQEFGVGFEQRAGQDDAAPEEKAPDRPVLRVADPDK
ncbi:MAG: hypothetical protein OXE40_14340 [Gammaproteobacteria bacterium]|nr:hypothetical protein [Gammaproteobacteria bacterium]